MVIALEAAKNRGQVAPKALEAAVPVPVAPTKNSKNLPRVAKADLPARSLRARIQFKLKLHTSTFC
jgi:hypothetical protein